MHLPILVVERFTTDQTQPAPHTIDALDWPRGRVHTVPFTLEVQMPQAESLRMPHIALMPQGGLLGDGNRPVVPVGSRRGPNPAD